MCRPPVLPTLQKYIFREMGKTFLLTAIGLTAVLSTCGGAASILPLESLTARQTLFLLALAVPISTAFTLPIAALFSATITYGRLAADNEFTAVRSGGINIHVLFLPCLLLSLVSGIVTFVLFNFAIPGMMRQMRIIAQNSAVDIVAGVLKSGESIDVFKGYRIRADGVRRVALDSGSGNEETALYLENVVFLQFEANENESSADSHPAGTSAIKQWGWSDSAMIKFFRHQGRPQIEVGLENVTRFGRDGKAEPRAPYVRLGPLEFSPGGRRVRPKHLSLWELLDSRRRPEEVFSAVTKELDKAREAVQTKLLFNHLLACLERQAGGCELQSAEVSLRIEADQVEIAPGSRRERAQLRVTGLKAIERVAGHTRRYQASEGRIRLLSQEDEAPRVQVLLTEDVTLQEIGRQDPATSIRDVQLGPFALPSEIQTKLDSDQFANEQLWNKNAKFGLGPEVDRQLKRLRKQRSKYLHQIYAEINVRTVYSISVLVLAILGAALGMIYRGGHLLVAFGISFVPTLFVVVLTILGKNIAKGESTLLVGLAIMWLGLIIVTSVDYVVLKRYVPR